MTKFGRRLRFGLCFNPASIDVPRILRLAVAAERLGLDYVGVRGDPSHEAQHDPWELPAAIGAGTSRASLFSILSELSSPEEVARAAASLDRSTGGRVEIGFGTDARLLVGSEMRAAKDALDALEEAIELMRLVWRNEPSPQFAGQYYRLTDSQPITEPVRRIGLWLGGHEPGALALAARLADGWFPGNYPAVEPHTLEQWSRQLDESAVSAGRDPSEIQRIWAVTGTIINGESTVPFEGNAKQWADWIAELSVEVGMDTFLLMDSEGAEDLLLRYALEVVPRVRDLVGATNGEAVSKGLLRAYQGARASGATRAEEATGEFDCIDETSMESFPASDPPATNSYT